MTCVWRNRPTRVTRGSRRILNNRPSASLPACRRSRWASRADDHGAEFEDGERTLLVPTLLLPEQDRPTAGQTNNNSDAQHERGGDHQSDRGDPQVEAPLEPPLTTREAMPPQREERHAVDGLEDDPRCAEVGHPRRDAHGHTGPERRVDQLQRWPADSRAGDDHRRDPFTRTDLTDVIDYSENGGLRRWIRGRWRHLNEPADAIAHPRSPP